jgi:predicted short-subunit dehydrogenase-like oxidoreductase (DUF2520 family)
MEKTTAFKSYALLGSGHLAHHLLSYLKSLQLPVHTWARRHDPPERLAEMVAESSHVLFAVRDEAIADLSRPFVGGERTLVHFSGTLKVPGVHAAHPLMTFGADLYAADWYPLIPFVHEPGVTLAQLLPGLPNHGWPLADELRPLYHALCALAGNSAFLLWQNVGNAFEKQLGLPRTLLQPFLHQTVANSARADGQNFTGPVARSYWETVRRHLHALTAHPELRTAYRAYLDLAKNSGHPIPEVLL